MTTSTLRGGLNAPPVRLPDAHTDRHAHKRCNSRLTDEERDRGGEFCAEARGLFIALARRWRDRVGGRLYDAEDMLRDPHFKAREAIINVDDPVLGPTTMQGVFPKFSETPGRVRRAAPREVGQDTADVLKRWLGEAP